MQKNQIVWIDPKRLHLLWPFVRQGLEQVIKKTKPEWLPEDIYSAIRTNSAFLIVAFTNEKPCAFSVFYYTELPFSVKKEQFIWVTYTIPLKERDKADSVDAAVVMAWRSMEEHARAQGAYRQSCLSPRPGFERWSRAFGFKKTLSTFERLL